MVALDDSRDRDLDRHRILAGACRWAKGPYFLGYFLFSLVFFPAALIVAYMVSDKTRTATA
jgi:hypothetical protein